MVCLKNVYYLVNYILRNQASKVRSEANGAVHIAYIECKFVYNTKTIVTYPDSAVV